MSENRKGRTGLDLLIRTEEVLKYFAGSPDYVDECGLCKEITAYLDVVLKRTTDDERSAAG